MSQYQKKPVIVEAIRLSNNNIAEVYRFIHGDDSIKLTCRMAEDRWDEYEDLIRKEGMKLKTPESGGETQIASIGDYIVKGNSPQLGDHFWPVKSDYFELNYDLITN